jgi:hypothetical protein
MADRSSPNLDLSNHISVTVSICEVFSGGVLHDLMEKSLSDDLFLYVRRVSVQTTSLRTADSEIFPFFLVISHISIVNNPTNSLIYFAACLLGRDTVFFFVQ